MNDGQKQLMRKLLVPAQWIDSFNFPEGPTLVVSPAEHLAIKTLDVRADNVATAVKTLTEVGFNQINGNSVQIGSLKLAFSD
tara:strand:+ start:74 stop:319 length:246 start_codon:yes stop_codon:yes gene_type:complete